jgi:hypothetical protein
MRIYNTAYTYLLKLPKRVHLYFLQILNMSFKFCPETGYSRQTFNPEEITDGRPRVVTFTRLTCKRKEGGQPPEKVVQTQEEVGQTPVEAGQTPVEAGQSQEEEGQTPVEVGQTPVEAGQTPVEAGQSQDEEGQTPVEVQQTLKETEQTLKEEEQTLKEEGQTPVEAGQTLKETEQIMEKSEQTMEMEELELDRENPHLCRLEGMEEGEEKNVFLRMMADLQSESLVLLGE